MPRWRYAAATGIIVLLAAVLVALLVDDDPVVSAAPPPSVTSTTALPSTTSTTTAEQRVEEVRIILEDLWFGWFDAIYRKDPEALWRVVANEEGHEAGVAAMDRAEFTESPTREGVVTLDLEILLDRPDCLVVYVVHDLSAFKGSAGTGDAIVDVLWPDARYGWRFAAHWKYRDDLWQADCDYRTRESTP